jgi:hypothetical protein
MSELVQEATGMDVMAYEQGENVLCLWVPGRMSRVRVCSAYGCHGV